MFDALCGGGSGGLGGDGLILLHGLGDGWIVGDFSEDVELVSLAIGFDFLRFFGVEIGFVDDDVGRDAEMLGGLENAVHVVNARGRGLYNDEGERGAGDGGDDGATDAGRAIDEDEIVVGLFGVFFGLGFDFGNELAGIFLPGNEIGMEKGAIVALRMIPMPGEVVLHGDGIGGAVMGANLATFTSERIDGESAL